MIILIYFSLGGSKNLVCSFKVVFERNLNCLTAEEEEELLRRDEPPKIVNQEEINSLLIGGRRLISGELYERLKKNKRDEQQNERMLQSQRERNRILERMNTPKHRNRGLYHNYLYI